MLDLETLKTFVFPVEVDYGQSEKEYAANFKALRKTCPYIHDWDEGVNPENYPSFGAQGMQRRLIKFVSFGKDILDEDELKDAIAAHSFPGFTIVGGLRPFDLLAACLENQMLGVEYWPLISSPEYCVPDRHGNRRTVIVTGSYDKYHRSVYMSLAKGHGWSKNCLFPVHVL